MNFYDFIETINPSQAALISYLDKEFLKIEGVSRKMRFKVPFYDLSTWICYLNPTKSKYVELCFLKGKKMHQKFEQCELRKRKQVSGYMMDADSDLDIDLILKMLHYACILG